MNQRNPISYIFAALIIVTAVLITVSCTNDSSNHAKLNYARKIVDELPDSAISILCSIDSVSLANKEELAHYALLKAYARHKAYLPEVNDTLLGISCEYFRQKNDQYNLMLSLYLQARISYNSNNYPISLFQSLESIEIANNLSDHFWIAKNAQLIADIYTATNHTKDALKYAKLEYKQFKLTGKQDFIDYALFDLCQAYVNNFDYDHAINLAKEAIDSARAHSDQYLEQEITKLIALAQYTIGDYNKASSIFDKLGQYRPLSPDDLGRLGISYFESRQTNKSDSIFNLINDSNLQSKYILLFKYLYAKAHQDKNEALRIHEILLDSVDNSAYNSINSNFINVVDNLREKEKEYTQEVLNRKDIQKKTILATCILLLIIAALVFIILYNHQRQKNGRNLQLLLSLKEMLDKSKKELSDSNDISKQLFNHFNVIDNLCKAYFEDSTQSKKILIRKIDNIIISLRSDQQIIGYMGSVANRLHNNIYDSFISDFPSLKSEDYLFFLYSSLGLSSSAIAAITNTDNITSVYNRRARLKKKIKELHPSKAEAYLKAIG